MTKDVLVTVKGLQSMEDGSLPKKQKWWQKVNIITKMVTITFL